MSRRRDFGLEDFKKVHPGGGLGRQLMPVVDAMRFKAGQNLPLFPPTVTVEQAFAHAEQSSPNLRRPGALLIVDDHGKLIGIFTDGDLRRAFIKQGGGAWREPIGKFMKSNPRRLPHTAVVRDAVQLMREFRIDEIPVVDEDDKPLGLVDVQDLVALKVIEGLRGEEEECSRFAAAAKRRRRRFAAAAKRRDDARDRAGEYQVDRV